MTLRERGYLEENKIRIKAADVIKALASKFSVVPGASMKDWLEFKPKDGVSPGAAIGLVADLLAKGRMMVNRRSLEWDRRRGVLILGMQGVRRDNLAYEDEEDFVEAKGMTYAQAREMVLDALEDDYDWKVKRRLKIPHATKGDVKIWFKKQAIYLSDSKSQFGDARSMQHIDYKKLAAMNPEAMSEYLFKEADGYINRGRPKRRFDDMVWQ